MIKVKSPKLTKYLVGVGALFTGPNRESSCFSSVVWIETYEVVNRLPISRQSIIRH